MPPPSFAADPLQVDTEILKRMMLRTQTPAISAGELCRALIKAEPAFEKSDQYESIVAGSVAGLRPVAYPPWVAGP